MFLTLHRLWSWLSSCQCMSLKISFRKRIQRGKDTKQVNLNPWVLKHSYPRPLYLFSPLKFNWVFNVMHFDHIHPLSQLSSDLWPPTPFFDQVFILLEVSPWLVFIVLEDDRHQYNSGTNVIGVTNHFMIRFKFHFPRCNPSLAPLLGQDRS